MASFDLGALLKGLSGGMGKYADIQFAERLQREAEQRKIAAEERALERQRLLAGEAFDRQKQLQEIIANRGVESEQRALMDELQRALGTARGMDMPGMGALDNEKLRGLIPREDMNALIGELTGASQLKAGAEAERKAAYDPENVLKMKKLESDIAANEALVGARNRSNRGGGAGAGAGGEKPALTPLQLTNLRTSAYQSYMEQYRSKVKELDEVIFASPRGGISDAVRQMAMQQKAKLPKEEELEQAARDYAEAYVQWALESINGPGEAPTTEGDGGVDLGSIYDDVASEGELSTTAHGTPGQLIPEEERKPYVPEPYSGASATSGGRLDRTRDDIMRLMRVLQPEKGWEESVPVWDGDYADTPVGYRVVHPQTGDLMERTGERTFTIVPKETLLDSLLVDKGSPDTARLILDILRASRNTDW